MAIATFIRDDPHQPAKTEHLRRSQVASLLGIHPPAVDKLRDAGVISLLPTRSEVQPLAARPRLRVASGELTVLRTNSRAEADPTVDPHDAREWIGFHVDHTDAELAASSLRWWRGDAARIIDNRLFAVTLATIPVAVFLLDDQVQTHQRPGEEFMRYGFSGKLVARIKAGGTTPVLGAVDVAPDIQGKAEQIMNSRITVTSGGPIGYLEPAEVLDDEA